MPTRFEMPPGVLSIIAKHGLIADLSLCERFGPPAPDAGDVERLLCMSPVIYHDTPYAAALLMGGSELTRAALKQRLQEVFKVAGFDFTGTRMMAGPDSMLLMVPWQYRTEFRAAFSSVVLADASRQATAGGGVESIGSYPQDLHRITQAGLQAELYRFGLAFDGRVQRIVDRLIGKTSTRQWQFPLGCTIHETRSQAGTQWEISFDDFEYLDRAYALVEAILAKRTEGGSLRMEYGSFAEEEAPEGVETVSPKLRLASADNSRSTRVEMARIVKELMLMLMSIQISRDPEQTGLGEAGVQATEAPAVGNVLRHTGIKALSPKLR